MASMAMSGQKVFSFCCAPGCCHLHRTAQLEGLPAATRYPGDPSFATAQLRTANLPPTLLSSMAMLPSEGLVALQAVMGFIMVAEDPLFRIYVLGAMPVGPLKRPFKKDVSPFAA